MATTTVLGAALLPLTIGVAIAQSLPDACAALSGRTIHWIVPSKPGGSFDAYSRLVQPFLEEALNARVRIDNRPEAGGIVAAMAIRDAPADGRTIGIVNVPGLLNARVVGNRSAPDPGTDFTILARVAANDFVMLTGAGSGISSIGELLETADARFVLVAVRDAGSSNFVTVPIAASLLGLDVELVTGYVGNANRTLAAIRGEVDIVIHSMDSSRGYVESDELLPLLQVTGSTPVGALAVPLLDGPDGVARQRASVTGRTAEQAVRDARGLSQIIASGRVVVAPPGLPESLTTCLGTMLLNTLQSDAVGAAAQRADLTLAPADRETAYQDLLIAARELARFEPLLQAAIARVRQ